LFSKARTSLAAPLVVFLALLIPLKNGFTDDGYIHIQYARNIVERGEYSFNPGDVSFGTTSPLWVMIQAVLGRVFGTGESLVSTSRALSWLAGFAAVGGMILFGRSLGLAVAPALCCALLLACHAWFVRWTALGMESSCAVLAMIGAGIVSSGAYAQRRSAYLLGVFMALGALVRPEAYLLFPVYLVGAALGGRRTDWGCVARTVLVYALLIGPWLAFAKLHIGSFLPNTAGAKSGGLVLDPLTFVRKLEPVAKIVGSTDGVAALLVLGSVLRRGRRSPALSHRLRLVALWILALPVAYVLLDIQVLSRYMLLTAPFLIVLGVAGLDDWISARSPSGSMRRRRLPLALAAITAMAMAANIVFYFAVVLPPSTAFSHDLTHNLRDMALFIRDHSDERAVVAAADIGYLAFYSKRRVLDLGGLVENETLRLREAHTYEEIVEKGLYLGLPGYPRVDYFIDRELVANRFDGVALGGYRFETVLVTEVRNLGIRKPGPYFYTLYRLTPERG
jgi:hypothetical protein